MPITPHALEINNKGATALAMVYATDYATIQAAINALPVAGGLVIIPAGTYTEYNISVPSNISIRIDKGATISPPNGVDADLAVFVNADPINGNSNIHIYGDGIIDGNEYNQAAGRQFGISFTKVTDSSVDIHIRRCRTADTKFIDTYLDYYHNKRFFPEEIMLSDFEGIAEWTVEVGTAVRNATEFAQGYYSWKLTPTGAPNYTTRISKALASAVDISSHYISMKLRSSNRLLSAIHIYLRFYAGARYFEGHFYRSGGGNPIPWNVNEWMHYTFSRSDFVAMGGAVEQDWEQIDAVKIEITSTSNLYNLYLDELKAIRCVDVGIVSLTFDDGVLSQYDTAFPLMSQYDYAGTIYLICRVIQNGTPTYLSVDDALAMTAAGWDISSHTWSHPLAPALDGLSDARVITEMVWAKEWLIKRRLGQLGAIFFAYPGGGVDLNQVGQHVYAMCRAGEEHHGTENIAEVIPWFLRPKAPVDLAAAQDYIDKCIKYHNWTIMYFHAPDPWFSDMVDYLHDNGVNVLCLGEVYQEYKSLLKLDTIYNQDYGDAVNTPSNIAMGVSDVYGAETRVDSFRGRIVAPKLKITIGGVVLGDEIVTVKVITWWDNEADNSIELTFNATGSYWLNDDNWLALWEAVTYTEACRYIKIQAKSSKAVTNATVATDVIA